MYMLHNKIPGIAIMATLAIATGCTVELDQEKEIVVVDVTGDGEDMAEDMRDRTDIRDDEDMRDRTDMRDRADMPEDMRDDREDMRDRMDMTDMEDMRDPRDMNNEDMRDMRDMRDRMDMSSDMPEDMSDMSGQMSEDEVDCSSDPDKDDDEATRCMRCASPPPVASPDCDPANSFTIGTELSGPGAFSGTNLRLSADASIGSTLVRESYLLRDTQSMGSGTMRFRVKPEDDPITRLTLTYQQGPEAIAVKARTCPTQGQGTLKNATGYIAIGKCGSANAMLEANSPGNALFRWNNGKWERIEQMGLMIGSTPQVIAVRPK